jgi:hypothetical protein
MPNRDDRKASNANTRDQQHIREKESSRHSPIDPM